MDGEQAERLLALLADAAPGVHEDLAGLTEGLDGIEGEVAALRVQVTPHLADLSEQLTLLRGQQTELLAMFSRIEGHLFKLAEQFAS
jgi:hypothetical protein